MPPPRPPGQGLSQRQKTRIIEELQRRGAVLPCSRCGTKDFTLTDGLGSIHLGDGKTFVLGGPVVPTVMVICVNCGALYPHVLGVLGLFDEFGIQS
jgi:hypothetical protein